MSQRIEVKQRIRRLKMRISIYQNGVKRIFHFNIKQIIREFHTVEEPYEQEVLIRNRMEDLCFVNGIGRDNIKIISRIKRAYLVEYRHLDYILNGLLKMAEGDAAAQERAG